MMVYKHSTIQGARGETAGSGRVLVVGSAGGIGSTLVSRLIEAGVDVYGADTRSNSALPESRQALVRLAAKRDADDLMARLDKEFGAVSRVAIAIGTYHRITIADYDEESFHQILNDNFAAVFWLVRAFSTRMAGQGGGRLALVSSQAGATGGADPVYAAAKAATTALAKSVAREFGRHGVRCNVVSPGPVDTPMARAAMSKERWTHYESSIPIGRFSTASEVAGALEFLLMSDVDAINGATLDLDGGLVRR